MIRGVVAFSVVMFLLSSAGCGDDSDPDTFCCAIKQICSLCDCLSQPGVAEVANAGEGDACRFVLEDNDLDCALITEETAIANCAGR